MTNQWTELDINLLVKADWNYKEEDDEKKEKLKANIAKNGQVENLLVRELEPNKYEVVNGNHRLDAMKEIGSTKVVVFNFGTISKEKAVQIAIETNETKFETNESKLAGLISLLAKVTPLEELEKTMPMNKVELEAYLKMSEFSLDEYRKQLESGEAGSGAGGDATNSEEKAYVLHLSPEMYDELYLLLGRLRKALKTHMEGDPLDDHLIRFICLLVNQTDEKSLGETARYIAV